MPVITCIEDLRQLRQKRTPKALRTIAEIGRDVVLNPY
jgi:hypothetical protein